MILVCSELHTKIGKREETMCVVESLLVFAVAAFYFAVVAGCVGTDQLVPDPKTCGGQLKACDPILLVGRKTVGKLNTIVALHVRNTIDITLITMVFLPIKWKTAILLISLVHFIDYSPADTAIFTDIMQQNRGDDIIILNSQT